MSCAACQARVEKAVSKVEGVDSCSVSLLTNSMGVEGNASPEDIIRAVTDAGYGARLKADDIPQGAVRSSFAADEAALEDRETPVLKKRLIASIGFLIVLMYFSMGHMMWGWPLPKWFAGNHVAMGLVQLVLSALVMVVAKSFGPVTCSSYSLARRSMASLSCSVSIMPASTPSTVVPGRKWLEKYQNPVA